ncbi:hypothetical protein GCM10023321_18650 [Pseudonocardia eucalypti]|uniref:Uncharacterized protein n=1 Tax=Pseudonocardia eucalypti TaxID=648755 RepID=A0ABP9PSX4_9PSEU|nr:hypothetical protein [Pseudonocardia eucalypti]
MADERQARKLESGALKRWADMSEEEIEDDAQELLEDDEDDEDDEQSDS